MSIHALVRSPGYSDVFIKIRDDIHASIETATRMSDQRLIHRAMEYFLATSATVAKKYINEGSYFPALISHMRAGEYQKVDFALTELAQYPQFCTTKTRLCHAACKLQLQQFDDCSSILKETDDTLIEELIRTSRLKEKDAYEALATFSKEMGTASAEGFDSSIRRW